MNGDDTINGGASIIQFLMGGGGTNDFYAGASVYDAFGRNAITYVGGDGVDRFHVGSAVASDITLNYAVEGGPNGISVNFATGTIIDTFGSTDTVDAGITGVVGTNLADSFIGSSGDDSFNVGGGADTINGGAGFDQILYSNGALIGSQFFAYASGITVNFTGINAGTVLDPTGATDTFTNIERVRGTLFADVFNGGAGDDSFRGVGGNDVFNGGGGSDEVDYRADMQVGGMAGVTVNLLTGTATDGFGNTDTLTSIERIRGTQFSDILTGNAGNNRLGGEGGNDTLNGGAGDDDLRPGRGNDTVDGGSGFDRLVYLFENWNSGVTVNMTGLGAGSVIKGVGGTDIFTNMENFVGTNASDTFNGSANLEEWTPGRGNDVINSGSSTVGDYLSYMYDDANATSGVTINLTAGTVTSAFYGSDTLTGYFARIYATKFADTLIGTGMTESFLPSLGIDTITGGGGFDYLGYWDGRSVENGNGVVVTMGATLGAGTVVDGGGSTDTFTGIETVRGGRYNDTFNGSSQNIIWTGYQGNNTFNGGSGVETLDYDNDVDFGATQGIAINLAGAGVNSFGATDTISNVENVKATIFNDTIIGNALNNQLFMNDGIDTVYAGAGNDYIEGGAGASSILAGEAGDDTIYGGAGNDYMVGGDGNDVMVGLGGIDSLYGGAGNDYLVAGDGAGSVVDGGGGSNTLWGAGGADYMIGGELNDLLVGAGSSDFMFGNAGDDTFYGGQGTDYIFTNAGNDFVWTDDVGSPQSTDYIYAGGGTGIDTIADFAAGGGANHDVLVVSLGSGVTTFAQVMANTVQIGVYSVVTLGADQVYIYNVQPFQLTADNFLFL